MRSANTPDFSKRRKLTQAENEEILQLLAEGKTPKEVHDATGHGLTKIYELRRLIDLSDASKGAA